MEQELSWADWTEVRFASFLSCRFITVVVVNLPEKELAKCTSVGCTEKKGSGLIMSNF
mgnify:CR=1 FL=1